jgi:hypothetical protein
MSRGGRRPGAGRKPWSVKAAQANRDAYDLVRTVGVPASAHLLISTVMNTEAPLRLRIQCANDLLDRGGMPRRQEVDEAVAVEAEIDPDVWIPQLESAGLDRVLAAHRRARLGGAIAALDLPTESTPTQIQEAGRAWLARRVGLSGDFTLAELAVEVRGLAAAKDPRADELQAVLDGIEEAARPEPQAPIDPVGVLLEASETPLDPPESEAPECAP